MTPLAALVLGLSLVTLGMAAYQKASKPAPRLYRVILPVSDIERAAAFYTELLASEGRRVSPGRHYFDAGEVILALVDPGADGDGGGARPNQDYVYFAVPDLEGVFARAERLGGLVLGDGDGGLPMGRIATRPWGERSFYMKDPFGNPLSFVDETTLFTGK
ncbi:MAG TPA: VOC family protein [Vicinamibacteria bacterium]|nr:VOC family protein [Vicinamibacteria bacterium]